MPGPGAMRALIVEHGSNRGALAAARALHRAGWTVDLVSSGRSLTGSSRSVRRSVSIDYPAGGPDRLVDAVRDAVAANGSEVVLPVDETQLLVLSRHRDRLGALLPYPPHDVLERATDRYEQSRAAERAGLAPAATELGATADLARWQGDVVVKGRSPALRELPGGWGRVETTITPAREAAGWVADLAGAGIETIVQDVLTGDLASMTLLTDGDGKLIAQEQQAAERIWPPGAGTSVRATTVEVDGELGRRAVAFLEDLGWRGLAQLQFLVDAGGTPHFIDFNPRFYGSLSLAVGAGANFPALWAASATGREHPPMTTARPGVRYHWFGGDLRGAMRQGRGRLVPELAGSVAWGRSAVHPIWSLRDPGPGMRGALAPVLRRLPGRSR